MKRALLTVVIAIAGVANAAGNPFGERAQRAKLVEESPDGKAYQQLLWKQIGDHTAAIMQAVL
jgi:hypothetical protein